MFDLIIIVGGGCYELYATDEYHTLVLVQWDMWERYGINSFMKEV